MCLSYWGWYRSLLYEVFTLQLQPLDVIKLIDKLSELCRKYRNHLFSYIFVVSKSITQKCLFILKVTNPFPFMRCSSHQMICLSHITTNWTIFIYKKIRAIFFIHSITGQKMSSFIREKAYSGKGRCWTCWRTWHKVK